MLHLRKSGLRVSKEAALKTSQTQDDLWVAWIEVDGQPITCDNGKPRLFEAPTRYQAQCLAYKWYQPQQEPLRAPMTAS